jgi:hypothetical protein
VIFFILFFFIAHISIPFLIFLFIFYHWNTCSVFRASHSIFYFCNASLYPTSIRVSQGFHASLEFIWIRTNGNKLKNGPAGTLALIITQLRNDLVPILCHHCNEMSLA